MSGCAFSFVYVVSDSKIKFSQSFISAIPVVAYMILYFVMAFVAGLWRPFQIGTVIRLV